MITTLVLFRAVQKMEDLDLILERFPEIALVSQHSRFCWIPHTNKVVSWKADVVPFQVSGGGKKMSFVLLCSDVRLVGPSLIIPFTAITKATRLHATSEGNLRTRFLAFCHEFLLYCALFLPSITKLTNKVN